MFTLRSYLTSVSFLLLLLAEHQSPPQLRYHFVVPVKVQVVPSAAAAAAIVALPLRRPERGVVPVEGERAGEHLRHVRVVHQQRRDARELLRASLEEENVYVKSLCNK